MPDIDSLSIQITAVSDQADRTLKGLIGKLREVQGALNMQVDGNLAKGMDDLSSSLLNLDSAIREIDPNRLKMVARSLSALSKASHGLSELSQVKSLAQTSQEAELALAGLSNEAKETARTIAEKYGIGADRMKDLASHVRDLYAGDTSAGPKLVNFINKYGDLEKVLTRSAEQAKEIRNLFRSGIKLPKDLETYYRGREDKRDLLSRFGIRNINKGRENGMQWDGPGGYAEAIADITGDNSFREMTSGAEVLDNALKFCDQHLGEMETKLEVVEDIIGHVAQLSQNIKPIEVKGDEFLPVSNEPIGFLGEDIEKVTQAVQQASEVINPFNEIAEGLTQLGQVQVPDFTGIKNLASAMGRLTGENIQSVSSTLPQIAQALNTLDGVRVPNLEGLDTLASGLRSLGSKNVRAAADALPKLVSSLRELGGDLGELGKNVDTIGSLGKAFASLGYKSVQSAIDNMPKLADSFNKMARTLSNAPQISENTIRLAQAMGGLSGNAMRAGASVSRAGRHFNLFNNIAQKTQKSTKGLAQVIGKIYATYWLLFRAFGKIKEAIGIASDLTEVQNVVDTVFGDARNKVQDFADTAIMTFGMSELSAKEFASRFQAMGTAMGITNKQVISANTALNKSLDNTKRNIEGVADSYKDLGDSTSDMSINLTKLAADIGSFYNKDYSDVADDLASIYTGQTRPLRAYGLDLTEATLKEYAMSQGLDSNIKKMTQAEKTMLRYRYVMANMGHVMNDYAITANTWANVTRTIGEQFKKLGQLIGQGLVNTFKPALIKFRDFLNGLIGLTEKTLNAVGKLLGWQIEITEVGLESAEDSAEGIADNIGDATDNAKELNKQLAGFDRLNNLTTPKDSGKNNSGNNGATGGASGNKTSGGGVKFEKYKSEIDSWRGLGEAIASTIADELDSINWEKDVYPKAKKFGSGLAQFMNGLFSGKKGEKLFKSLGKTIAGAVNTVMIAAKTWAEELEWAKIGKNIKDGLVEFLKDWKPEITGEAVGGIVSGIAQAVYSMVSDKSAWDLLGEKISTGIQSFIKTMNKVDPLTGKNGWEAMFLGFWDTLTGLASTITKVFEDNWEDIAKGIADGITAVLDDLKENPDKLMNLIKAASILGLATTLATKLGPMLSPTTLLITIGQLVVNGITGAILGRGVGNAAGTTVGSLLGKALSSVGTKVGAVIEAVKWSKSVAAATGESFLKVLADTLGLGAAVDTALGGLMITLPIAATALITWNEASGNRKKNEETMLSGYGLNPDGSRKDGQKKTEQDQINEEYVQRVTTAYTAQQADSASTMWIYQTLSSAIKKAVKKINKESSTGREYALTLMTKTALQKNATKKTVDNANKEFDKNPAQLKVEDGNSDDEIVQVWDSVNKRWISTTKKKFLDIRAELGLTSEDTYRWWDKVTGQWKVTTKEEYLKVKTGISDSEAKKDKDEIWTKMVEKWGTKKLGVGAKAADLKVDLKGSNATVWTSMEDAWGISRKLKVGAKKSDTLNNDLNGSDKSSVWSQTQSFWGAGKKLQVGIKPDDSSKKTFIDTVQEWFKGFSVNVVTTANKANGGAYYNGKWHGIPQFANGGLPSHGTMFVAGEAGSEVVGHIGGRTEVLNESQLASVMYDSVNSAMAQQNALLREEISYLKTIAAKDMSISSRDVFNAVRSESTDYKNRTGRLAFGV